MQPTNAFVTSDANTLPSELLETPQPVIGFIGLDCTRNLVHKSIWDAFNNNRKSDRAPIQFKLMATNYEFPVLKPKRQSYEWYHPKGILKRNWILKHLHVLPAVIVLFQDMEWNDPQWTEKQYQCASLMQTIKGLTQGRNTKLAIVLLQKNAPLPPGEDVVSSERISNLASVCDINQKMIFVLPYNDHLTGYTLRLESAFLEQTQSYYTQMSKQVRTHREQLTSAHQGLKIRHQFKLGFFAEMRLDLNTALKHFVQAYEWLEEIRIVDTNCLEIKVVAGFLNYKICKLMFNVGSPRDAITQFRTHIDKYRNRTGFKELLFEHFAWLSVQYNAFAELFCDAIKCGLPALQTQHPGIYFHKSAEYVGKRKDAFQQCCAQSLPLTDFLSPSEQNAMTYSSILYSDFFGIRGGNKTSEPITDQQIIAIVQECEKSVNHSALFITLLGQAMAQFKIYKCLRFRKKLAIDMAEEYLKMGDYSKALTLYSLMLNDYRSEKWNCVFTQVLLKTLRSAFLSASVADFIACSLEALSNKIFIDQNDRIIVLENLWKVYQKVPPMTQSQIVPELRKNWETSLANFNTKLTFDLDKISKLFECTVKFEKPQIRHDEIVRLQLFIRSASDVPLKIRDFAIIVSDSKSLYKLNAQRWIDAEDINTFVDGVNDTPIDTDFMMHPNRFYRLTFEAVQYQFSENSELQISRLEMTMGTNDNSILLTQSSSLNMTKDFKNYNRKSDCLANIDSCPTCYIIPIFHLSAENSLSHKAMLTNEYFKITTNINNEFHSMLENVSVCISIPDHLRNKVFIAADLSKSRQKLLSHFQVDIGNLASQGSKTITFNVISLIEGTIDLAQTISYHTSNGTVSASKKSSQIAIVPGEASTMPTAAQATQATSQQRKPNHNISIEYANDTVIKMKKDNIVIPCTAEFLFTGKFYSLSKEPLTKLFQGEDFLFRVDLEVKSVDIDILDMFLISDHNITEKPYGKQRRKYGQTFSKGERIRDVRLLHATQTTQDWITRTEYQQRKSQKVIFGNTRSNVKSVESLSQVAQLAVAKSSDETYRNNLLAKIPINSTIIGSTNLLPSPSSTPMNRSFTEDPKLNPNASLGSDSGSIGSGLEVASVTSIAPSVPVITSKAPKTIYNTAMDAFTLTDSRKGFLNTTAVNLASVASTTTVIQPVVGIYCIRWRRSGQTAENETKLIVNCLEIVEAPLNIHCYLDEKMYVKVPMTLSVTIKNSSNATMHLKSYLKNADNFMFAGNTQLNISLFAKSTYNLVFNLYPLKAGWQQLPEFEIKYNTPEDVVPEQRADEQLNNLELQKLVQRWMPKRVFILPMVRQV